VITADTQHSTLNTSITKYAGVTFTLKTPSLLTWARVWIPHTSGAFDELPLIPEIRDRLGETVLSPAQRQYQAAKLDARATAQHPSPFTSRTLTRGTQPGKPRACAASSTRSSFAFYSRKRDTGDSDVRRLVGVLAVWATRTESVTLNS
jgi:hypothetical protein